LTLSNPSTANPVIRLIYDVNNIKIKNTIIKGNNNANSGLISIDSTLTIGHKNIVIDQCKISPINSTLVKNIIYSFTPSTSAINDGIIFVNNSLIKFSNAAIYFPEVRSQNISIKNNYISSNQSNTTALYGIWINTLGGTNEISKNRIVNLKTSGAYRGINVVSSKNLSITENEIMQTDFVGNASWLIGIHLQTGLDCIVKNNIIGLAWTGNHSGTITGLSINAGLQIFNVINNTILLNGSATNSFNPTCFMAGASILISNCKNNIFFNNTTSTTSGKFAINADLSKLISDNNIFIGKGLSTTDFLRNNITTFDFTQWKQQSMQPDLNSFAFVNNTSGGFISDYFNSVINLRITNTSSPAADVGSSNASVLFDIDGNTRSNTPDIGADEFSSICNMPVEPNILAIDSVVCNSEIATIKSNSALSSEIGIVKRWLKSNSISGTFSPLNLFSSKSDTIQIAALTEGIHYIKQEVLCQNSNLSAMSNVQAIYVQDNQVNSDTDYTYRSLRKSIQCADSNDTLLIGSGLMTSFLKNEIKINKNLAIFDDNLPPLEIEIKESLFPQPPAYNVTISDLKKVKFKNINVSQIDMQSNSTMMTNGGMLSLYNSILKGVNTIILENKITGNIIIETNSTIKKQ
jgi:hypothetical protein